MEGFDIHRVLQNKSVNLAGNALTDSTKRLWDYTYPQGASEKRRARILSKPGKYFQIARAVAAELGEPEAVLVSQVFEGCSLGTEELPEGDWDSENWARLADLLKQMAAAVMRDHDVEEYWRKLRATNGAYDVLSGSFRTSSYPLDPSAAAWGLAGPGGLHFEEAPPAPSITLGRRLQFAPRPGWIAFSEGEFTSVDYLFWLEVRLALGPVNDHLSVGSLLEFRTNLEARLGDGRIVTFETPFADPGGIRSQALVEGEAHAVIASGLGEGEWLEEPEFREGAHDDYFGWREVSPALLRYLMNEEVPDSSLIFQPRIRHLPSFNPDFPASRFSHFSPAGRLMIDLLTGALEAELGAECDRLAGGLDALRAEQDRAIREAEAEAMARWATKTATNPDVN
ncbi:MAG: hypothetical protein KDK53_06235 [Maritimibacter sp.]|nr:hypothetical protein [Maritimibacter sp.]